MVIDVRCIIVLFTTPNQTCVTNVRYEMLCFCLYGYCLLHEWYFDIIIK